MLRTGRKVTLHSFKGTAEILSYLDRYRSKTNMIAQSGICQETGNLKMEVPDG